MSELIYQDECYWIMGVCGQRICQLLILEN